MQLKYKRIALYTRNDLKNLNIFFEHGAQARSLSPSRQTLEQVAPRKQVTGTDGALQQASEPQDRTGQVLGALINSRDLAHQQDVECPLLTRLDSRKKEPKVDLEPLSVTEK